MEKQELIELAHLAAEMTEGTRIKLTILPHRVQRAYHHIRRKPGINALQLADMMDVAAITGKRYASALMESGLIERIGSRKSGGYYITEEELDRILSSSRCKTCFIFRMQKR